MERTQQRSSGRMRAESAPPDELDRVLVDVVDEALHVTQALLDGGEL
jgi:hypothetical protein